MKLFYLCHPVGGDVPGNVARALRWLAFLRKHERGVVITAPWIPAILAGEDDADPAQRERGLRDCLATVARFDGVILCGGRVSAGMRAELGVAIDAGLAICDLSELGEEPGWPGFMDPCTPLEYGLAEWQAGLDAGAKPWVDAIARSMERVR